MKLILFTSYFTINTSFLFLLDFFSMNHHRNHLQILISIFYLAAAAILHRNPSSSFLKDETLSSSTTTPFLDRDRETVDDHERVREFGDGGHDYVYEGERCKLCGYEGDDEDDGEYEDEDFSKRIEEFINGRKKEWREEMIRERLLFMEGAKL